LTSSSWSSSWGSPHHLETFGLLLAMLSSHSPIQIAYEIDFKCDWTEGTNSKANPAFNSILM
jgi:hypothetical protein